MGHYDSEAPVAVGPATISPLANGALISTDSKESGLWLWNGEAPPSASVPQSKSFPQRILSRIIPVAIWAGGVTLAAGLVLTLIAVSMLRHPNRPQSGDAAVVEPSSTSSPTVVGPTVAPPPAAPAAQLDQAQKPPEPTPATAISGAEPQMMKAHPGGKSVRKAKTTHKSHPPRGAPIPAPGVLTPPSATWHGGGY